jgi:hypothetical protein
VRNKKYQDIGFDEFFLPPRIEILRSRFYPFLTFLIRKTYDLFLGKALHSTFRSLRLLDNTVDESLQIKPRKMPPFFADLIQRRFLDLAKEIEYRREIALVYAKNLPKEILSKKLVEMIPASSNLRFPIFVEKRSSLFSFLKQNKVYISDTWYDAPIAPRRFLPLSSYKNGECPAAERVASTIVNLPTHREVSKEAARNICSLINQWLASQSKQ